MTGSFRGAMVSTTGVGVGVTIVTFLALVAAADHHWKASIESWSSIVRKSPAGTKCWFEFYRKSDNTSYVTSIVRKERV